jgi:hypothetical protein
VGALVFCAKPGAVNAVRVAAKVAAISWREAVAVMVTPEWTVDEKVTGLGALVPVSDQGVSVLWRCATLV